MLKPGICYSYLKQHLLFISQTPTPVTFPSYIYHMCQNSLFFLFVFVEKKNPFAKCHVQERN